MINKRHEINDTETDVRLKLTFTQMFNVAFYDRENLPRSSATLLSMQEKCSLRGNLINYSDNASFPIATIESLFLFENPVTGKMAKCAGVTKAKENDGFEDGCPDKNCYLFGWPTCCAYIGFRVITASTFIYYLHKYMNGW